MDQEGNIVVVVNRILDLPIPRPRGRQTVVVQAQHVLLDSAALSGDTVVRVRSTVENRS